MNSSITDFYGRVVRVASYCQDCPYLCPVKGSVLPACSGCYMEIFEIVASKLNFSFTWQARPSDGKWGSFINGNWTGMFQEVVYGDKDLTINSNLLNQDRSRDLDFSQTLEFSRFGIVAMEPSALPQWTSLFVPFKIDVWVYFLVALITLIICSIMLTKKQNYIEVIRIAIGQSAVLKNLFTPQMLWIGGWLIASFIMLSAYITQLSSVLSVEIPARRMETIKEVVDSNKRIGLMIHGGYMEKMVKSERTPAFKHFNQRLDVVNEKMPLKQGVALIKGGHHCFLTSYPKYLIMKRKFNFTEGYFLKEAIYYGRKVWYFKKKSWMKKPINDVLVRLIETGIFQHHIDQYFKILENQRKAKLDKKRSAFNLFEMQGAFVVLMAGLIVASIVFMVELFVNKSKSHGVRLSSL